MQMSQGDDDRDGRAKVDALDLREMAEGGGNGVAWLPLIQDRHAPPKAVTQAIATVMANMGVVAKSQENKHGGYKFASTDDIYAATTKKMGEIGLILVAFQEEWEIKEGAKDPTGKIPRSLRVAYSFMFAVGADAWHHPQSKRDLLVQYTGPQTFQAAESYAKKQFLRSTFQIPTGDMDLDSMPDDMAGPIKLGGPPKPPSEADIAAEHQKIKDAVAKRKETEGTPVMTAEQGEQAKAAIEEKPPEDRAAEPVKEIDIYGQIEVARKFFEKAQNKKMLDSLYDRFVNTYRDHMHLVGADLEDMYKQNLERVELAAKK
jgi:hypothetical protein